MTASTEPAGTPRKSAFHLPRLHLITDDRLLEKDFLPWAAVLAEAGGARLALHLRGPRTPARRLYALAIEASEVCRENHALLVVNGRADIAAAVGAAGVHLGERSVEPRCARRIVGDAVLVGRSLHRPLDAAELRGADYLIAGNVYRTPSHPGRPAAGTKLLGDCRESGRPVIAIGGITPGRVREVRSAGAYGVAVLSGIWRAADPVDALEVYLNVLAETDG